MPAYMRNFSSVWLVGDAQAGMFNGSAAPDESNQSLTFVIAYSPMSFFLTPPRIEVSNLTFQLAEGVSGVVSVRVMLKDNGGITYGGVNFSDTQTYTINILPVKESATFVILPNVTVEENSGFSEILNCINGISAGRSLVQVPTFSIIILQGPHIFEFEPGIFVNGSLLFAPRSFAHGSVTLQVTVSLVGDAAEDDAPATAHNITIFVLPVNQAPTLLMTTRTLTFNESQTARLHDAVVAYNVTKGSVLDMENFEELQNVSFSLVQTQGNASLFGSSSDFRVMYRCDPGQAGNASSDSSGGEQTSLVTLCENGKVYLVFGLAPFVWGSARFNLTLQDSGGRERGGWDTAATESFDIQVLPVNSAPSFDLSSRNITVLESLVSMNTSVADIAINIWKGPVGYSDEDWQLLTFELRVLDQAVCYIEGEGLCSSALLLPLWPAWLGDLEQDNVILNVTAASATLSAHAAMSPGGLLSFQARAFEYGSVNLSVTLHDNGGRLSDGLDRSREEWVQINVLPVNNQPAFTMPSTLSVNENSGNTTRVAFVYNISRGSPTGNEDAQNVTFSVVLLTGNQSLFVARSWVCGGGDGSVGDSGTERTSLVAVCEDGEVQLEVAPLMHGTAIFSVEMQDSGGTAHGGVDTADMQTLTIVVSAVNNAPEFDASHVTVWENFDNTSGSKTVPNFAFNISAGSMLEGRQVLSFRVEIQRHSGCLFARTADFAETGALPVVSQEGHLTFALAAYMHGSFEMNVTLVDDGGRERRGIDTSHTKTFTVTILSVNNAPSFTLDKQHIQVNEGAGNVTVGQVVSSMSAGPPRGNETSQMLRFSVVLASGDESIFVMRPWSCNLPDAASTFSSTTSAPLTAATPAPAGNRSNSSNASLPQEALVCYDDAAQSLFEHSNHLPGDGLDVRWLLCPNGEFVFELMPFANGVVSFNISLRDDGGVERGGVDTSLTHLLSVQVDPVNSKPSFSLQTQVEAVEDSGNQSRLHVATHIQPGAVDETDQNVTFSSVLVTGSGDLFVPRRWLCPGASASDVPLVTLILICPPHGLLLFELAPNMVGSATFNVSLQDSGGREGGGIDTSSVQVLNISVASVNDAPSFKLVPLIQVWESSGEHVIQVAFDLSSGTSEEGMQTLSFDLAHHSGSTFLFVSTGGGSTGGQAAQWFMNASGALTFALQPFASGNATLAVTLRDSGGNENGGESVSATLLLHIQVLSRNNAPSFQLQRNVSLLEDQTNISIPNFVYTILQNGDSNAPKGDESQQQVTLFAFVQAGSHLLERLYNVSDMSDYLPFVHEGVGEGGLVDVDANGTLSMKLVANLSGMVHVGIVARDNGGTQGGMGVDRSEMKYAFLSVGPVNDVPSFHLFQGDCFRQLSTCSDTLPTIMMMRNSFLGGNAYVARQFVQQVSVGPPDEALQMYTFHVRKVQGDNILSTDPSLDAAGNLIGTQLKDAAGTAIYKMSVTDSGGEESGGLDTSLEQSFRFITIGGSVQQEVTLNVSLASLDKEAFHTAIALKIGYPRDLIALTFSEVPSSSRRLLSVYVTVTLFAATSDAKHLATIASNLGALVNLTGVTSLQAVRVVQLNTNSSYAFSVADNEILVNEDSGLYGQQLFVRNVSAADVAQIVAGGKQVVYFDVQFVSGSEETTGSTDAQALFLSTPAIEWLPCEGDRQCGGTLTFALRPNTFGTAHLIIYMRGAGIARAFSIRVAGVNDRPSFRLVKPHILLQQSLLMSSLSITVPGLVANVTAGAGEDTLQTVALNVTVVSTTWPLNWPASAPTLGGGSVSLMSSSAAAGSTMHDTTLAVWFHSFTIDPLNGTLTVVLKADVFGNVTVSLEAVDNLGTVSNASTLVIEIEYVNQAPTFRLATTHVSVLEDCAPGTITGHCNNLSFTYANFGLDMFAGRKNEEAQGLSFDTSMLGCQVPWRAGGSWQNGSLSALVSRGCPSDTTFPGIDAGFELLLSTPLVIWPNGTMTVSLVGDRHGAVQVAITLSDNGGTERGGLDRFTLDFLLDVVSVNDAPSATLNPILLNMSVNEGCSNYAAQRPYAHGCTWVQDAHLCGGWRGASFSGCWFPLYECAYSPTLHQKSIGRDSMDKSSCPASCNSTVEGEVVFDGGNMQILIMNQVAFKMAVVEAFKPLQLLIHQVAILSISNITLPYAQQATRSLVSEHSKTGLRAVFSIDNLDTDKANGRGSGQSLCGHRCLTVPNNVSGGDGNGSSSGDSSGGDDACACMLAACLESCVAESLRLFLEAAHNSSIFPSVGVSRLQVRPRSGALSQAPATCVDPPPPPRVQCQDGKYVLEGQVNAINAGAWGEEDQVIWFTVHQTAGGAIGEVQVALPFDNVTSQALVMFQPTPGLYGLISFSVTIHDSGGTTHGGIDTSLYPNVVNIHVKGYNRQPSFEMIPVLFVVQDSSCVQIANGAPCAATCQHGKALCQGGSLSGSLCNLHHQCPGKCASGNLIAVSVSCTGSCSCDQVGNGLCSAQGLCSCRPPNSGAVCYGSSECTGGGQCDAQGTCTYPSDTAAACVSSSQCDNQGVCVLSAPGSGRHERYSIVYNVTAGSPLEDAFQTLSYIVVPQDEREARKLFVELPTMRSDGSLVFNLTEGSFGRHLFSVHLTDDSGDLQTMRSETRPLTIVVNPTNALPDFSVPDSITVFEDSDAYDAVIALDIFSPNAADVASMAVHFEVTTDEARLFVQDKAVGSPNASLSTGLPQLDKMGRFKFRLAPHMFGETRLVITMIDSSRLEAGEVRRSKQLLLTIQPVNNAPTFGVAQKIMSFPVNSPRQRLVVMGNITLGPANEVCNHTAASLGCQQQHGSFIVEDLSNPFLFLEFPAIDAETGELVFRLAPDTSGVSTVTVRLVDDGLLNDDLSHAACVEYSKTAFFTKLTGDAAEYRSNGANVNCLRSSGRFRGGNTSQVVTLLIQALQGPPVQQVRLLYSVNLTSVPELNQVECPALTTPYPTLLHHSVVTDHLGLVDQSALHAALGRGGLLCSMLPGATYDLGQGVDKPNALVLLALNQGDTSISSFAVIVREGTYIPASVAVFRRPVDKHLTMNSTQASVAAASLKFLDRRQSFRRMTAGLEYSTALSTSPDGLHVYAVEGETDSISVWNIHKEPRPEWHYQDLHQDLQQHLHANSTASTRELKPEFADKELLLKGWPDESRLSFVERRAHTDRRLRLRGVHTEEALTLDRVARQVYTPDMPCALEPFENSPPGGDVGNLQLLAMAGGCQDPALDHLLLANHTVTYMPSTTELKVLGRWIFSSASLYGNHSVSPHALSPFGSLEWADYYAPDAKPTQWQCNFYECQSAFEATGNVTCTPGRGCRYTRGSVQTPDCKEPATELSIYPATIGNSASGGGLGALVLTGPKCRSHATAHDWLLAPTPGYSLINFLVNDGKHEALQFDGLMNSGLFLTNDLETLVSKDPGLSKLPTHAITIEAWVTVDSHEPMTASIMSAAVSAPGCAKGWFLFYELSGAQGAMALKFVFEISLEANDLTGLGIMKRIQLLVPLPDELAGCCDVMGLFGTQCNCFAGQWFQVVASYDTVGLYLQVSFVHDTQDATKSIVERTSMEACTSPPCGAIVYPTSYHPFEGEPTADCNFYGPVPVVVGNYTGRQRGNSKKASSHVGLIKEIALYAGAMGKEQADRHFEAQIDLVLSRPHWQRYWGKAHGISPSIDLMNAQDSGTIDAPNVTVHGLFLTSKECGIDNVECRKASRTYRCRWSSPVPLGTNITFAPRPLRLPTMETEAYAIPYNCSYSIGRGDCSSDTTQCDMATCLDVPNSKGMTADSISLTCPTPYWPDGMQGLILTIAEGYLNPDVGTVEAWSTLWQKACVSFNCGYTFYRTRLLHGTAHSWMFASLPNLSNPAAATPCGISNSRADSKRACGAGALVLSPAVHGTITHFTIAASTTVWTFDLSESGSWRGEAPVALQLLEAGRYYLASQLVLSSRGTPLDKHTFDATSFKATFDSLEGDGGMSNVRTVQTGLGLLPASKLPSDPLGPSLTAFAVFPAKCAVNEHATDPTTWCNRTSQEGAVTRITLRAGSNTSNCTVAGTLTAVSASGTSMRASYTVGGIGLDGRILPVFTFDTVNDRGSGFLGQDGISLVSSQHGCGCKTGSGNITSDLSQCFQVQVAWGARFHVKAQAGLQKAWRLAPSRWGTAGLVACDRVVGCLSDALAAGHLGASSVRALKHHPSGGSLLFVSNYHDGRVREVNSTVWLTEADSGQPSLLQGIPSAGAMDIDVFPILPRRPEEYIAPGATSSASRRDMMVAVANYHGPSVVYRWTGAVRIVAIRIDATGRNFPASGRIVGVQGRGRYVVGSFQTSNGSIVNVSITSQASFLPGLRLEPEYDSSCGGQDMACDAAPIAGSVVSVTSRPNTFISCGIIPKSSNTTSNTWNLTDVLTDAPGKTAILSAAGGLQVRISKVGAGVHGHWTAQVVNFTTHGSGYRNVDDVRLDAGSCRCNGSSDLSMHACLIFEVASGAAELTPLPHGEGAPGISTIHIAMPGHGYGHGVVRAVLDGGRFGSGLRAMVHAFAGGEVTAEGGGYLTGALEHASVGNSGNGYLPDTLLDIFYAPHCALHDAGCEDVRMEGSVTGVQQQWHADAGRIVQCVADGTITALPHAQGGQGFVAHFHALPSGSQATSG